MFCNSSFPAIVSVCWAPSLLFLWIPLSFIQFFTAPFLLSVVTAVHTRIFNMCILLFPGLILAHNLTVFLELLTRTFGSISAQKSIQEAKHKRKQKHKHNTETECRAGAYCRGNHLVIAGYKSKLMHNSCTPWKEVNAQSQAWSQQDFYPAIEYALDPGVASVSIIVGSAYAL